MMTPRSHLIIFILFLKTVHSMPKVFYGEGDPCETLDNKIGVCRKFRNCAAARNISLQLITTSYFRCGFSGMDEIICCDETSNEFVSTRTFDKDWLDEYCTYNAKNMPNRTASVNMTFGISEPLPHVVPLGYVVNGTLMFKCSGIIISEIHVITSAHCAFTLNWSIPMVVRVRSNDLQAQEDFRIKKIMLHEFFSWKSNYHDIAILILETALQFSYFVRPACFYDELVRNLEDDSVKLGGWNFEAGDSSSFLYKIDTKILPNSKCNETYSLNSIKIIDGQICTEFNSDLCQSDKNLNIEGPIHVYDSELNAYHVIGIASFGRNCGTNYPKVYTKLSNYKSWIEKIVTG